MLRHCAANFVLNLLLRLPLAAVSGLLGEGTGAIAKEVKRPNVLFLAANNLGHSAGRSNQLSALTGLKFDIVYPRTNRDSAYR